MKGTLQLWRRLLQSFHSFINNCINYETCSKLIEEINRKIEHMIFSARWCKNLKISNGFYIHYIFTRKKVIFHKMSDIRYGNIATETETRNKKLMSLGWRYECLSTRC